VIFRRIRLNTDSVDLGVFLQQIREDVGSRVCTEQGQQQLQHQLPHTNLDTEASSPINLPPLRSVIEVPRAETTTALERPSVATVEDEESP
jgi:hypothetical protein